MATTKAGVKKKINSYWVLNVILGIIGCVVLFVLAGLGCLLYQQHVQLDAKQAVIRQVEAKRQEELRANPPPLTLVNDSVAETVRLAKKHGWIPYPGDCLKLATPGWHHEEVAGHPPSDVWFTFRHTGGWVSYSQHHIGHIIHQYGDRQAQDVGICPICGGTGWVKKDSSS